VKDYINENDIATVLFNLSSVHVESGNSGKAIRCFTECIIIMKTSNRVDLVISLAALKCLGCADLKRDVVNVAALKCFNKGVQICRGANNGKVVKAQLPLLCKLVAIRYKPAGRDNHSLLLWNEGCQLQCWNCKCENVH